MIDYSFYDIDKDSKVIVIELDGGITDISDLRLVTDNISYINSEDKYIILDLENKEVKANNLGISLRSIDEESIVIKLPDRKIELKRGIVNMTRYYDEDNRIIIKMDSLKQTDKIIKFEVIGDEKFQVSGFDIKIVN